MIPTGRLDPEARTLTFTRRFPAAIDDVWASITESERLSRWFGTWTGDPADGWVVVTMHAEAEPFPPTRYEIEACEPPRLLSVAATDDHGSWKLVAELVARADGTTELILRQDDVDLASAHEVGPGWDWYLDRLVAAVAGVEGPSLDAFDADYGPMGAAYAAMVDPGA